MLRRWLRRLPGLLHLLVHGPTPEPQGGVQPLVSHTHVWGGCKWNGQYWYARCIAYEWCTARIAC